MLESEDNARDASEHSQARVKSIQSFVVIVIITYLNIIRKNHRDSRRSKQVFIALLLTY